MIKIGKQISEKRKEKLMRQEDLARMANLSIDYIGKIERGERTPQMSVFIKLLNLLEASADDVLDDYLEYGYGERLRSHAAQIKKLSNVDREKIFAIIEELHKHRMEGKHADTRSRIRTISKN